MKSFSMSRSSGDSKDTGETKKCPDCLAEIPKEAKKCSHCGTKQKAQLTKKQVVGVLVFMVLFVVMIASIAGSGGSSSSSTTAQVADEGRAHIIAQNYVETILKSPSTADFPTYDYTASDLGNGKFKVISYVDSQNSFGATVRSNYTITLSHNGGDWADSNNWTLHEFIFDGEVIVDESATEE